MLQMMQESPAIFFCILGVLLLILELLGTGGYLLWCGISALITSFISFFIAISLFFAWLLFAVLALVTVYLWWFWLKKRGGEKTEGTKVNQKYQDLIGMETVVSEEVMQGQYRVRIYDGSWKAVCAKPLKIGEKVRVIAVNEMILTVEQI